MIGRARNQYRSFADVQTTVENKIERATKRPTALIIGKTHPGAATFPVQSDITRSSFYGLCIEISRHNDRATVVSYLIANRK